MASLTTKIVSQLDSIPEDRVVELLRNLHHGSSVSPPARSGTGSKKVSSASTYDTAREHLADHERRLRREAQVTDRVIAELKREAPPPQAIQQQLLRIVAAPGSLAGGRFVLSNSAQRARRLDLSIDLPAGAPCRSVEVTPHRAELGPGEEIIAKVYVDLDDSGLDDVALDDADLDDVVVNPTDAGARRVFEFEIDVRAADEPVANLWVEVEIAGELQS